MPEEQTHISIPVPEGLADDVVLIRPFEEKDVERSVAACNDPETDELLASVGFVGTDWENRVVEIGSWVCPMDVAVYGLVAADLP